MTLAGKWLIDMSFLGQRWDKVKIGKHAKEKRR
jgi:hypothetical protein